MPTFSSLGVRAELTATLARRGIESPFPVQVMTIPDALAGRDVCGKAETGSGKTLAFGLPLLQRIAEHGTSPGERRTPRALVLVPTRELAGQVVAELEPLGEAVDLAVRAVYGGRPLDRDVEDLHRGVDLVVATPGRLIDLLERKAVSLRDIRTLVVDEADRMADMGFLPQVEWVMRHLGEHRTQMLLFSATLDGAVDVLVRRYLTDPVRHEVESESVTVENMVHRFLAVHQLDRVKVVASIARGAGKLIVFCRTKRGADRLVRQLEDEGVRAGAIHGDLPQPKRERVLRSFSEGRLGVLVATDVAARGIHVEDVDVVVHFDPPEDHKAYLHRSGRTARKGAAGTVATFVLWDQHLEVDRLKKHLGLRDEPTVEVLSNDPRLADLRTFALAETSERAS